jgi:hypothetical protein
MGPLGTAEEESRLRGQLTAGDPLQAAERLLHAVTERPVLPPNVTRREFDLTAAELLAELGQHAGVRMTLERSLSDPCVRAVAIDALALLGDAAAGPALAALAMAQLESPTLSQDELVSLASALGCVGGPEARTAVNAFRAHPFSDVVAREIDIAHEALGG